LLPDILSPFGLFKNVDAAVLRRLAACTGRTSFGRGQSLLRQGQACRGLLLLADGSAEAGMQDSTGKSMTVEEFCAPAVLAAAILFAGDNTMPVSLRARSDGVLLVIDRQGLLEAMAASPALLENVLAELSDKLMLLSERLSFMAFRSTRSKVAHYLARLPMLNGDTVVLPRSIEELAVYFGVARPALSKVLSGMAEAGLIEQRHREIRLLDVEALLELAE
jgi:CRP/FNR family transcriptional regulator, dissimilatory nitrate respiration regulator